MDLQTDNEIILRQFLLGALPAAEREAVEDRFMVEGELFAALGATEEDLLEEYARGELSAPEREQIERHLLLVPRNRERARLLRTMQTAFAQRTHAPAEPTRQTKFRNFFQPRVWRYALLAACLIVACGFGWWLLRGREQGDLQVKKAPQPVIAVPPEKRQQPAPSNSPLMAHPPKNDNGSNINHGSDKPQSSPLNDETAPPHRAATQPFIATLILSAGATRSEGRVPELSLPAGAQAAQIKLMLETNDYAGYRAVLTDEDGAPIWTSGALKAREQTVTLNLPARFLREGDYFLKLNGLEANTSAPAAEYSFRVRTP
ncbi:MAG: zf-HC2 domain-containing protein [Pyrinomonadaceae bacterium]|nr:zf-HC2 domain-containing protein [Pyrinomonadaceae bacterium]